MRKIPLIAKVIATILCCVFAGCFVWEYWNDIVWFLKRGSSMTTSLNYNEDISYIELWGPAFTKRTSVDNKDEIDKLFEMLNSLEVVERRERGRLKRLGLQQYIDITVHKNINLDAIHLSGRYIIVFRDMIDWESTIYYARNLTYEFQDERNEIAQYLRCLTAE